MAIIAEGIPERITQKLNKLAKEKGVTIIGPATVTVDHLHVSLVLLLTIFHTLVIFLLHIFAFNLSGGKSLSELEKFSLYFREIGQKSHFQFYVDLCCEHCQRFVMLLLDIGCFILSSSPGWWHQTRMLSYR